MPRLSPPVSPVEYSALPSTDDSSQSLFRPSLDQVTEEIPRSSTDVSTRRQSDQPQIPSLDDDTTPSNFDDSRILNEQYQTDNIEPLDGERTSVDVSLKSTQTSKSSHVSLQRFGLPSLWRSELGCCLLVVCALIGMIITIYSLDGKPLPHWPYRLSINTFIAAFSVAMKASSGLVLAEGISHVKWTKPSQSLRSFEVQDEASRGPWGAFNLLRNDLGRSVASLGALITILILFLETFSQQMISFIDCEQTHLHASSTISRTNAFSVDQIFLHGDSLNIPWGLRNSVNQGMYAKNKLEIDFDCDSGNCTFPQSYSSVAYCHTCHDVTAKLISSPWSNPHNSTLDFLKYPNMTLFTEGDSRNYSMTLTLVNSSMPIEEARNVMIARGQPSIDIIRVLDWHGTPKYAAYSCEIVPCVKTYSATINKSVIKESVEDEYIMKKNWEDSEFVVADLNCVDPTQREDLRMMGYDLQDGQRWTRWNVSVSQNDTTVQYTGSPCDYMPEDSINKYCDLHVPLKDCSNASPYSGCSNRTYTTLKDKYARIFPPECVYSMNHIAAEIFLDSMVRAQFTGLVTEWGGFGGETLVGSEPLMAIMKAGSGNGTFEDFDGLIKDIADSATTYVRESGLQHRSEPATGTVQYSTVCIKVRWPWLAYSAATTCLTVLFFVCVVIRARRDQLRLHRRWADVPYPFHDFKSSALTLLFHGLDKNSLDSMADVGSTNREKELKKLSRETKVQLVPTDQGWKLATADG